MEIIYLHKSFLDIPALQCSVRFRSYKKNDTLILYMNMQLSVLQSPLIHALDVMSEWLSCGY